MKRRKSVPPRIPTHDEFHQEIDRELGFLTEELRFSKNRPVRDRWRVDFRRDRLEIVIKGEGYGTVASMDMFLDGRRVPYYRLAPTFRQHFTPTTDCPQLDQIRECAYRLRHHLFAFVAGDYADAERVMDRE